MARIYRKNIPTTLLEGAPLNAHLTTEMQKASEALFEETRNDYCVVLQSYQQEVAGWYLAACPVMLRCDRDGRWRSPEVQVLIAGNGTAETLCAVLTDSWREPDYDAITEEGDPGVDWTTGTSSTLAWTDLKEIVIPPSAFAPPAHHTTDGDEENTTRIAWLSFFWAGSPASPLFGGYRVVETVDDL